MLCIENKNINISVSHLKIKITWILVLNSYEKQNWKTKPKQTTLKTCGFFCSFSRKMHQKQSIYFKLEINKYEEVQLG